MHTDNTGCQNLVWQWMRLCIFWHKSFKWTHILCTTQMWKGLTDEPLNILHMAIQKNPTKPINTLHRTFKTFDSTCTSSHNTRNTSLIAHVRESVCLSCYQNIVKPDFQGRSLSTLPQWSKWDQTATAIQRTQIRTLCMHRNGVTHQPVHAFICNYSLLCLQS